MISFFIELCVCGVDDIGYKTIALKSGESKNVTIEEKRFFLFNTIKNFNFSACKYSNNEQVAVIQDPVAIACYEKTILTIKNIASSDSIFQGAFIFIVNSMYAFSYFTNYNKTIGIPVNGETGGGVELRESKNTFSYLGMIPSENSLYMSAKVNDITLCHAYMVYKQGVQEILKGEEMNHTDINYFYLLIKVFGDSKCKFDIDINVSCNYEPENPIFGIYKNYPVTKFLSKGDLEIIDNVGLNKSGTTLIIILCSVGVICSGIFIFFCIRYEWGNGSKQKEDEEMKEHSKIKNELMEDDDDDGKDETILT